MESISSFEDLECSQSKSLKLPSESTLSPPVSTAADIFGQAASSSSAAAWAPQQVPSMHHKSDAAETYSAGADGFSMAARAKEMGLEARAAALRAAAEERRSGGLFASDHLALDARAHVGDEDEEREEETAAEAEAHGGVSRGATLPQTFLAIIKSTIGPALLFMPHGFADGGWLFAGPMLLSSYALIAWSGTNLLEAHRTCGRHHGYASLMGKAFGKPGSRLVRCAIVLQQCGICLAYFIFVATNLHALLPTPVASNLSMSVLCVAQLAAYMPLSFIRNIQSFAVTNLMANGLILFSVITLTTLGLNKLAADSGDANAEGGERPLPVFNPSRFYLFVGTSAFIFEGVMALALPLQSAVKREDEAKFPTLFVRTLGAIVVLYLAFGFLNYAAYGPKVEMVLTGSLSSSASVSLWKAAVESAYALAVLLSFPLQLFPASQILQQAYAKLRLRPSASAQGASAQGASAQGASAAVGGPLSDNEAPGAPSKGGGYATLRLEEERTTRPPPVAVSIFAGNVGRSLLVALLCAVAIAEVDRLDKVVSLLGAFLGVPLAFIFPTLIHLRLCTSPPWVVAVNYVVVALGVAMCAVCSTITLATW